MCLYSLIDNLVSCLQFILQHVCRLSVMWLAINITLFQYPLGNLGLEECFFSAVSCTCYLPVAEAVCVISQWLVQSCYFVQCRQGPLVAE